MAGERILKLIDSAETAVAAEEFDSALFHRLRAESLFSMFPEPDVALLLSRHCRVVSVPANALVPREAPPRVLYLLLDGAVTIGGPGRPREVRAGGSLELETFLSGETDWRYEWRAEKASRLLAIDGDALYSVIHALPELKLYLLLIVRNPELQRLKNDLTFFGFSKEEVIRTYSLLSLVDSVDDLSRVGHILAMNSGELTIAPAGGTFVPGTYLYLPPDRDAARLELASGTSFWALAEPEWSAKLPSEKVQAFVNFCRLAQRRGQSAAEAETRIEIPLDSEEPDDDEDLDLADFAPIARPRRWRRRTPEVVRQSDQMECGAACLSTVARYYGRFQELSIFRDLIGVERNGASLFTIKAAADEIGFQTLGVAADLDTLRGVRLPAIALMRFHFVVVFAIEADTVWIGDPAAGLQRLTPAQFAAEYSGHALLFRPGEAFETWKRERRSLWSYAAVLRGQRRFLLEVLALSVVAFGLAVVRPFLLGFICDHILARGQADKSALVVLVLTMAGLLSAACSWVRGNLVAHISGVLDAISGALFLRHVYELPLAFFASRKVGDVTSRQGELQLARSFITSRSVTLLTNALSLGVYGLSLGLFSGFLLAISLLGLAIFVGLILFTRPLFLRYQNRIFDLGARTNSLLAEQFRNLETLRSLGATIAARWRLEHAILQRLEVRLRLIRDGAVVDALTESLQALLQAGLVLAAVSLFLSGDLTLGQAITATTLAGLVIAPAAFLAQEGQGLSEFVSSLVRIDEILSVPAEARGPRASEAAGEIAGDIELRNVGFRYGGKASNWVLRDVSLRIAPGETVAFVGRSGSGKSTLAQLINLLYRPQEGEIRIDGRPVTEMALRDLRRAVRVVLQENSLFSGTVLENIALGDPTPSLAKAIEAAKAAGAHEFIGNLRHGYSTRLDEAGSGLSGGQRQRLCIARALYESAPVLILDEATSGLDAISERHVMKSLADRKGTTILIAHRLNTVVDAHRIFVLDRGRLVEQGTHQELLSAAGVYRRLFQRQLSSGA